jgi:hypothetical protein
LSMLTNQVWPNGSTNSPRRWLPHRTSWSRAPSAPASAPAATPRATRRSGSSTNTVTSPLGERPHVPPREEVALDREVDVDTEPRAPVGAECVRTNARPPPRRVRPARSSLSGTSAGGVVRAPSEQHQLVAVDDTSFPNPGPNSCPEHTLIPPHGHVRALRISARTVQPRPQQPR